MNALNEVRNTLKVIKKFWKVKIMVFIIVYIQYRLKVSWQSQLKAWISILNLRMEFLCPLWSVTEQVHGKMESICFIW